MTAERGKLPGTAGEVAQEKNSLAGFIGEAKALNIEP
jgi:hypothetical protein